LTSSTKATFGFLKKAKNLWTLIFCTHNKQWWITKWNTFNLQSFGEEKTDWKRAICFHRWKLQEKSTYVYIAFL